MWWRRLAEVTAGSVVLFVALPFGVRGLGYAFIDGVLVGTGVAIVWYTLETLDLRRETSILRREAAVQSALAVEQIKIATDQNTIAMEQSRRDAQERLKLDIFNEIAKRIEATRVPLTNLGLTPTGFVGELVIRQQLPWNSKFGPISQYEFSELQTISKQASDSIIALMSVLEIYEIVMPEFAVFRKRLAESSREATTAFGDFFLRAGAYLEAHGRGPLKWPPTREDVDQLSRLATITQGAAITVAGVVWDLRVAAQNYLLGGLFPDRHVPERTPGDPSVQITRLSHEDRR